VLATAVKNTVSGDITIYWQRRARIDGNLRDYVDVPLMEQSEQYDVSIMSGATVVRSWLTNQSNIVYTATQQVADFGVAPTAIDLVVTQRSALIGPGQPLVATVAVQ
jgi:hypothetical protein